MSIKSIRNKLEQKKGQRSQIRLSLSKTKSEVNDIKKDLEYSERAQMIVQTVAQKTQKELTYNISNLTTLSLESIFPEPYEFGIDFVMKRNKTEAEMFFKKDEQRFHPITASGGGVVDQCSFVLRPICWSLQNPKSRNVIIWDEPLKFLSRELLPKANEMIHMLSKKLELQMIIVTHLEELEGDKVFRVSNIKGVSEVR